MALTAVIYVILAIIMCTLTAAYPAAAVMLPVLFAYGGVCLGLYAYLKKKGDVKNASLSVWCTVFLAAADVYGLRGGEDTYFLFNVLCCAVGIAMCADLICKVRAIFIPSHNDGRREVPQAIRRFGILSALYTLSGALISRILRHPYIAFVIYLLLGALIPFAYQPQVSADTVQGFDGSAFYSDDASGERAKVISENGEALEERIRMISQAEERIILSTFEIDADTSGKMVMAALMEAADRGVEVCLLADGFPYVTAMWGNPYFLALAGTEHVEIRIYNPIRLWKPWGFMGRLHDKYLIADDMGYILGGRNTYDYFLGDQEGHKNYDWDVLVYSEDAGEDNSLSRVYDYFESVWDLSVCRTLADNNLWENNPSVVSAGEELRDIYRTLETEHGDWMEAVDYEEETVPVNHIELVSNPTHIYAKEPVVYYTLTELMAQAQESVTFHTPYIICNDWMLERLEMICGGEGSVTMMTNSVANNGNPFGASDYLLNKEEILDTGMQILEYDGGISYHGKCFVMDERISGIGSFNWDMRSVYLDTELMLVVDSEELNSQLREKMQSYEEDALTVLDAETSIAPKGHEAQAVGDGKNAFLHFLGLFRWARFVM